VEGCTTSEPATALGGILRAEIARAGSVPFVRFMEAALYEPALGYYERTAGQIGRGGDFYTSVSVGPMFGERLAARFGVWLEQLPARPVRIVETGPHDGRLAADLLTALHAARPELAARVTYVLVEPSPRRRAWQAATLAGCPGAVEWVTDLADFGEAGLTGILFSNEFLDALPVHRVGWDAASRRWFEWHVTLRGGRFVWCRPGAAGLLPALDPALETARLAEYAHGLPAEILALLPDGYSLELHPAATAWWARAAQTLRQGWLVGIDYGFADGDEVRPGRVDGTLRGYAAHRAVADVLDQPGAQDLTSQVPFRALRRTGEAAGMQTVGLASQAAFLVESLRGDGTIDRWSPAARRQFATLIHPQHLGERFRVLVQTRRWH
jgi:SAM-dependent MidA family methyltransferase